MAIRAVDDAVGDGVTLAPVTYTRKVITYGTVMVLDPNQGTVFQITATDGVAFTINTVVPAAGKLVIVVIKNTSGGNTGAITWGAGFKPQAALVVATVSTRTAMFISDGTNLVEVSRNLDTPN